MKVLFVSGLYPKGTEVGYQRNSPRVAIQNAPNAFQWAFVNGLKQNNVDFDVVTCPFLPSFPNYKKMFIKSGQFQITSQSTIHCLDYCTFIGYKEISIKNKLVKFINNWVLESNINVGISIVVYSTISYVLSAVATIKKKYPNIKICIIVTDLIDDSYNFSSNNNIFKRVKIKQEIKSLKLQYKEIDKFVLLTKYMAEKIPEAIGKSIIVEGMWSDEFNNDNECQIKKHDGIKSILYTGTLEHYSGIIEFVDAFCMTHQNNFRLIICGDGDGKNYILKKIEDDNRIIYKGVISRDKVLQLQKEVTLLVNPRKPEESITRYSFPSKTIEYLASGTPMMGYQLDGIPNEYYKHFFNLKDSENTLSELIERVLSIPDEELKEKGCNAKDFIYQSKTSKYQVSRIIEFLNY